MDRRVLVIGGGVTGMQVAKVLRDIGLPCLLLEKAKELGGRVPRLSKTFPFHNEDGFNDGLEFSSVLEHDVRGCPEIEIRLSTTLQKLDGDFPNFRATFSDGTAADVGAVVVATGFEPFDPTSLDEYGYGKYPNVVTASELEWILNPRGPTGGQLRRPGDRKKVERLGIVFCVGSRNRRIGAPFCSRICCSFSTKQAIHVLDRNPGIFVACFYMDIRTYDRGFEEMYSFAQENGVKYIRGRVSGCKELPDGAIAVRAENTLVQKPFWGQFDMVSLSTGMRPCKDVEQLSKVLGIERARDGFFACCAWFRNPHDSTRNGIFVAGCATGMKPIRNCMIDGSSVAARVMATLRQSGA